MKISNRLKTIASLVTPFKKVVDIGCDHGLLDIFLATHNNNTCIASDISVNALNNANANIKKYNLNDKITTILSDGTNNIHIDDNHTFILAGMGTTTIINILKKSNYKYIDELIVQSNNDLYNLRKELVKLGYKIIDEVVVFEKKIYYVIIKLIKGKTEYTEEEYYLGPVLLKKKDDMTNKYFDYILTKNKKIINQINNKNEQEKFILENKWIIER